MKKENTDRFNSGMLISKKECDKAAKRLKKSMKNGLIDAAWGDLDEKKIYLLSDMYLASFSSYGRMFKTIINKVLADYPDCEIVFDDKYLVNSVKKHERKVA